MDKKQVKSIIKLLSSKDLDTRPALRKIFTEEGAAWATDGYIAMKIADVHIDFCHRCYELDELKKWYATANKNDLLNFEQTTHNEDAEPQMHALIYGAEYKTPDAVKIDAAKLAHACEFLGSNKIEIKQNAKNPALYKIEPLEMGVIKKAMGCECYLMGLK